MNQVATFALLGFLVAAPSFAQADQTNAQTFQAILTEVRAIHNEVRLSQTTQLLLTELEIQQRAVNRAVQRRDDFRIKVSQVQASQKDLATRLTHFPEIPEPGANSPEEKDMREGLVSELASLKSQESGTLNDLQEAENSLRKEQGTLDNIQGQLNDVVKKLQPVSSQ